MSGPGARDTPVPPGKAPDRALAARTAMEALRLVCASLPYLSGLAREVRVFVDDRVRTAGITGSGRLLVNPSFWGRLERREQVFIAAHELLHLALDTHGRGQGENALQANFAHDCVINDILEQELNMPPPAGGLRLAGASNMSLESLVEKLKALGPQASWGAQLEPHETTLGRALRRALKPGAEALDAGLPLDMPGDVLTVELERKLFPGEADPQKMQKQRETIRRAAAKASSLKVLKDLSDRLIAESRGTEPGGEEVLTEAMRSSYQPPWELALQRWFDHVAPGERSFARPSRRGADRADLVRAGRKREGWTVHLILDTSGSMSGTFAYALGMIATFCENANVSRIHLLQCDVDVSADEYLAPEELERYTIRGLGGSDMSPAMLRLAEDPEVEAVLVLTDGAIDYPQEEPPYQVLWVIADAAGSFDPPYGHVICVDLRGAS